MISQFLRNAVFPASIWLASGGITSASILDSDTLCRVYGCVMISDGFGTDVYDVFLIAAGVGTVPVGSPLIPWTGNPIQGFGSVDIVETGTTTPVPTSLPAAGNGTQLAIDTNGNGSGNISINDNNSNGYLDASDSLTAFSLTNTTDVVYQDNAVPHSVFLTSRNTAFDMRARSSVDTSSPDYGAAISLSDVSFGVSITQSGNDAGISYGSRANNGGFTAIGGINDLGDFSGGAYTSIALFANAAGIRNQRDNANNHVYRQSLRFNMSYGYPALDLSLGAGAIQFRVEYAPYKL